MVLSDLDDKWSQDKINTAFMCICNNINTCVQKETDQPYHEINYNGYLSDFCCTVDCAPRIDTPLWATNMSSFATMCVGTINHNKTVTVDSTSIRTTQCETSYIFRCEYYCTFCCMPNNCTRYISQTGCQYCDGICGTWATGTAPYICKYDNNADISSFSHKVWCGTNDQQTCYNCCLNKYTKCWTACVNYYSSLDYVATLEDPEVNECLNYYLNCPPICMYHDSICYADYWKDCTFSASASGLTLTQFAVDEMFFQYQNKNLYSCCTNYYYPGYYAACICDCVSASDRWNPNSQYLTSSLTAADTYCPYSTLFADCRYYGGRWQLDTNWIYNVYPYDDSLYNAVDSQTDKTKLFVTCETFLTAYRKTIVTCVIIKCTCQTCTNDKWCINQRYI